MFVKLVDMREKQVVCIKDGSILGYVSDFELDTDSGKLISIIIYGKRRFFGFSSSMGDCTIPWESIKVIGEDSILVDCQGYTQKSIRRSLISEIFSLK